MLGLLVMLVGGAITIRAVLRRSDRGTRGGLITVGVGLVLTIMTAVAPPSKSTGNGTADGSTPAAPVSSDRGVYYEMLTSCGSGADLTFTNSNGDITQQAGRASGWQYDLNPRRGQFLSVSAQNRCEGGYVTVGLVRDGDTLRENTSTGGYVIAGIDLMW